MELGFETGRVFVEQKHPDVVRTKRSTFKLGSHEGQSMRAT